MMEECIRSELDIKSSTLKESTNMITNRTVSALNGSILMGRIYTSWKDFVVPIRKEILDIRIAVKFATLIKVNIFAFTSRTVLEKKLS